MVSLQDIEEKVLRTPAGLVGFFTEFAAHMPGKQEHRTILLKRLFDFAGEPQPADLAQTQDETFKMDSKEIVRIAEKLYSQLKP